MWQPAGRARDPQRPSRSAADRSQGMLGEAGGPAPALPAARSQTRGLQSREGIRFC